MRTTWGSASDRGRVRTLNEDALLAHPPVFLVADGMGGHEAGDVASRLAVEEFARLAGLSAVDPADLHACFRRAAQRIRATFERREGGTTVSGVALGDHEGTAHWLVFNVGDSRVYRWADDELAQLTVDHSVVQELVDSGSLTRAAAERHPERHVLTRALGTGADPEPDYWTLPARPGDRMLVCSDGVSGELSPEQIADVLATTPGSGAAAAELVRRAVEAGGRDNATAVVVDVEVPEDGTAGWLAFGAEGADRTWDETVDGATIPRPRSHQEDSR
ncbi:MULTISPECIES: protein phosphatase 2C domain-containing protein [unclassified Cellulomonas]|uniref:PP2C family protein-serine/threonine phosphatase n=1 Tax=unclassified Cellulomonas TaxID=2620175 RepID=UPI0019C1416B|nr:protein phosphatase 2C domain-containing protein [Cellulomonas sp. ES6]MBD3779642.1 serine/threonine-protein phosphatase [Micrococcales bacterium]WHP17397.1 protein phosphatase 2C domain-containing protein [Cellulomonas sp. ES6]